MAKKAAKPQQNPVKKIGGMLTNMKLEVLDKITPASQKTKKKITKKAPRTKVISKKAPRKPGRAQGRKCSPS